MDMKLKNVIIGSSLLVLGIMVFAYYDMVIKPQHAAQELMTEAKMILERGDKESVNASINLLTKIIVKYPSSNLVDPAYAYIGEGYEKLGLYRLAYLKYGYLLKKNPSTLDPEFKKEIMVRYARIKVMQQMSEEAMDQLYGLLHVSNSPDFRSRIYSELGYTYLKNNDLARAKKSFDVAVGEQGNNEEAILGKARVYKRMGNDNAAYDMYEYFLKYYGALSQFTPDIRAAFNEQVYQSGLNAYRCGNYSGSISFFNRFMNNFPNDRKLGNALYWIGESYYAMKKFDTAISYFDRVLNGGYYSKAEDARIKKGYSYFMTNRFDLSAREFQLYINQYPHGRYVHTAREWKNMSTKEILYRIQSTDAPQVQGDTGSDGAAGQKKTPLTEPSGKKEGISGDEGVSGDMSESDYENVAEL